MTETLAGTDAAKPLVGDLVFIPNPDRADSKRGPVPLQISVLNESGDFIPFDQGEMDGVQIANGRIVVERKSSEVKIELNGNKYPVTVEPVKVVNDYDSFDAYKITYPDYDEGGNVIRGAAIIGARAYPSLTIPEVGTFMSF